MNIVELFFGLWLTIMGTYTLIGGYTNHIKGMGAAAHIMYIHIRTAILAGGITLLHLALR